MSPIAPLVRRSPPGRMKWRLAGGAVMALLIGALWRSEELPPTPGQPPVNLTGSAPVTFAPPAAGSVRDGAVNTRPDDVSTMEWMVLQGLANQHADADGELTRMVHFLRFNKQLERWEALGAQGNPALRHALASALVTDLPARVQQGDLTEADARSLLARLLPDVEPEPGRREARAGDILARIGAASRTATQASAQGSAPTRALPPPALVKTSP